MKKRPVLITDAERSQDDQLRSRQIRYATMMGLRIVCLLAAVVLAASRAPLLGLWLALCAAGMVLLPWMAVLIANDRPPKEEHRLRSKIHRGRAARAAVESASDARSITATPHGGRIIDPDN